MQEGIDTYDLAGLEQLVADCGQPRFRAVQLFEWLYGKGVESYDAMSNLSAALREKLAECAPLHVPTILDKQVSADGTRKYLLQLHDGHVVETVGIPAQGVQRDEAAPRLTVCLSSQVGCPMACAFCATGQEGFARNLSPGEIVQQLLIVAKDFDARVSNVVVMGQGEPFLNFDNVLAALRVINHAKGPGVGARHITVSTCGLPDEIVRFGEVPEQFTLAVSLHSAIQSVRDDLMPRCRHIPLNLLKSALESYQQQAKRRVSIEYLMIEGVNADNKSLDALMAFCQGLSVHINLLPINAIPRSSLKPCSGAHVHSWIKQLAQSGIEATLRHSRGADIAGACGQLKNSR